MVEAHVAICLKEARNASYRAMIAQLEAIRDCLEEVGVQNTKSIIAQQIALYKSRLEGA